ncbi:MAG: riboflavin synthase [Mariprofundaceae bacterium]
MFTGIILDVGRIEYIERDGDQALFRFSTHLDMCDWRCGDSIAVNGCCLTVTRLLEGAFEAVLSPETLARTTFGDAREGEAVNLEPALRAGDRLGGHFVSGHVDDVGRLASLRELEGGHRELRFSLPATISPLVAKKGSVAVNGVSLTVNAVDDRGFTVNLIPHTLQHTNLGELQPGMPVNIEADMLARHLARLMEARERT